MTNKDNLTKREPTIGEIKRFLEIYCADKSVREGLHKGDYTVAGRYGINLDPEEIRALWDNEYAEKVNKENLPVSSSVLKYRDFTNEKVVWRNEVREECSPENNKFKIWRERQMVRCAMEIGDYLNDRLIHTPICFELDQGCSVQCQFCGVDAKPLTEIFEYNKENAALWKEVLNVTKEFLGISARWGCCYFATEPMDNPDYEKFCTDFWEVTGMFPQTTTALPVKDIKRTRELLELSRSKGCRVDRFSILSLNILRKVYENFSADELTDVEIIVQNPESNSVKSATGRFYKEMKKCPDIVKEEFTRLSSEYGNYDESNLPKLPGTISCLTGFIINMVDRSIKLISPCAANDKWPKGYIIHAEGTFNDAKDLKKLMEDMVDTRMYTAAGELDAIRLRGMLRLEQLEDGFEIVDKYRKVTMKNEEKADYLNSLSQYVLDGKMNAGEISMLLFYKHGIPEESTLVTLAELFKNGVLDEETLAEA